MAETRKAMLSPSLLETLPQYRRESRPEGWLFPAVAATPHGGIAKPATLHTLRDGFATHCSSQR